MLFPRHFQEGNASILADQFLSIADHLPFGIHPDEVEPVYTTLPGWPGDLTGIRTLDEVPQTLLDYVTFIEEAVGVPVTVLSVGPDRAQTLELKPSA